MRFYTRPQGMRDECRALDVEHAGRIYGLVVEHVTLDQKAGANCRLQHAHPVYHAVIYTSGEGVFMFDNQACRCAPGVMALAAPGVPHAFGITGDGAVFYSEITFSFVRRGAASELKIPMHALLSRISGLALKKIGMPASLSSGQTSEAVRILTSLLDWLEYGGLLAPLRVRFAVMQLFEFLIRECFMPQAEFRVGEGGLLKARLHIEKHYAGKLAVAELARMAGMSAGHFQRAYRRLYGRPPIAHQQQLRVEAAKTLLCTTALRGKEIASRVGFGDEYYFSRAFRKLVGITPTQYRAAR